MIEQKLREYKSNLSKLRLIECEETRLQNELQLVEPSYISGTAYSDMPKSQTNKFSSITENGAIELEQAKTTKVQLKTDLTLLRWDKREYQRNVDYVSALLDGLTTEERFVIESFYFDKLTWPMIADRYRKEFGVYKSIRPLKYKRDDALKKLSENSTVLAPK